MGFPDFPFKSGGESFIHHSKVLSYLQSYAKKYDLEPNMKVTSYIIVLYTFKNVFFYFIVSIAIILHVISK